MTADDTRLPCDVPVMLPRLRAFALRLSGDRHDAEDLVQAAFVRALEAPAQHRVGCHTLKWMYAIVRTVWIDELRTRGVRNRFRVAWDDDAHQNVADPLATAPDAAMMYRQLLDRATQLPIGQRAVVRLVSIEGLNYRETAARLGVPIGTIMSRLARARRAIAAPESP